MDETTAEGVRRATMALTGDSELADREELAVKIAEKRALIERSS